MNSYVKTRYGWASLLGLIWLTMPAYAQSAEKDSLSHLYYVGVKAHAGFIIPHSTEIINVSGSRPLGFQLDVGRINRSVKAWNKCNCYSQVGLSFVYFNYQNPDVLGSSYNLVAYMEPLLTYQRRLNARFRAGAGLTYLTDVYNADTNPTNLFFSSSFSGFLMVGFSAHYKLSDHLNANLGVHYNHISNGGLQHPNKGMNFPTLNLGMEYTINPAVIRPLPFKAEVDKRIHLLAGTFGNFRTVPSSDAGPTVNLLQLGLFGGFTRKFTTTNAWFVSAEFSHDASIKEVGSRNGDTVSPFLFSFLAGHQFSFGRFAFSQQMGHYTYRDYNFRTDIFQRYAIAYLIAHKVSVGFSLKAHGKEAEQMDIRTGYVF
jgi:Lipid A 3-O-deacylase (PagL)